MLVDRMSKQTVGTIKAHRSTRDSLSIEARVIGINRVVGRPTIIGAPGQFAALKQKIAGTVVAYDEDDVALYILLLRGQLPQIDAT